MWGNIHFLPRVIKLLYGPIYFEMSLSLTLAPNKVVDRTLKKPIQRNLTVLPTYKTWWQYIFLTVSFTDEGETWCHVSSLCIQTYGEQWTHSTFWRVVVAEFKPISNPTTALNVVNMFLTGLCAPWTSWRLGELCLYYKHLFWWQTLRIGKFSSN